VLGRSRTTVAGFGAAVLALLVVAVFALAWQHPPITAAQSSIVPPDVSASSSPLVDPAAATPTPDLPPTAESAPPTPTPLAASPAAVSAASNDNATANQPARPDKANWVRVQAAARASAATPTLAAAATPAAAVASRSSAVASAPPIRPGAPIRLKISRIGVDAPVQSVGLDGDGAMATPTTAFAVGWFYRGVLPGEPGSAVLDGHLDWAVSGAAVFWRLSEVHPGDKLIVQMPGNRVLTFVVDRAAVYPYDNAPLQEIFGASDTPHLNLVTCTGIFNRSTHNYDRRLVVYSSLAKG
jgi:sortase A